MSPWNSAILLRPLLRSVQECSRPHNLIYISDLQSCQYPLKTAGENFAFLKSTFLPEVRAALYDFILTKKHRDKTMSRIVELESWVIYQCIVNECNACLFMSENAFKARDISMRAQKKILSRMATRNVAKAFIDESTSSLLDNLYRLAKQYSNNKKEAEKLVKNIIKVVIKLAVVQRNGLYSNEEMNQAKQFRTKFSNAAMSIVSFYELDYSYDRTYLMKMLNESHVCLKAIVAKHLTDKSLARIDSVFQFFANEKFLDAVFAADSEYREVLGSLVADLKTAIERGDV